MIVEIERNSQRSSVIGPILIIVFVVVAISIAVFSAWINANWNSLSLPSRANVIIQAVGAGVIMILALATVLSVYQNRQLLLEEQREREQPVVVDVINNVIEPAVYRLENDINHLQNDDERDLDWVRADEPSVLARNYPQSVFKKNFTQVDQTALVKMERDYPDTFEMMESREELVEEMCSLGTQIDEKLRPELKEYVAEKDITNAKGEEPDLQILVSAILRDIDSYGDEHRDSEIWDGHKKEFVDFLHNTVGGEVEELENKETELLEMSKELKRELTTIRLELREEYGISSADIEPGNSEPEAV